MRPQSKTTTGKLTIKKNFLKNNSLSVKKHTKKTPLLSELSISSDKKDLVILPMAIGFCIKKNTQTYPRPEGIS